MIMLLPGIYAQNKKMKFSIGPQISLPTYTGINSSGIGGGLSTEHSFNKKIGGFVDVSYNYFNGNVYDLFKHDTIKGFGIMPVFLGAKYFLTNRFYMSGAAGIVIGINNAGNHAALSPGAGLIVPISTTANMDVGVRLIAVPTGFSFPENSFLNKGGYSFLSLRIAYQF